MSKNDDIINLPHHQSTKHPKMPVLDRAAQFLPFAALSGYDADVKEASRLTTEMPELSEDRKKEPPANPSETDYSKIRSYNHIFCS